MTSNSKSLSLVAIFAVALLGSTPTYAQFNSTGFGSTGLGGTTTTPNGGDDTFAEQRLREDEQAVVLVTRRMQIKVCADQLYLNGLDKTLSTVADLVEADDAKTGWKRITNYFLGAQLNALNFVRAKLKSLAPKKIAACNFKKEADTGKTGPDVTGTTDIPTLGGSSGLNSGNPFPNLTPGTGTGTGSGTLPSTDPFPSDPSFNLGN